MATRAVKQAFRKQIKAAIKGLSNEEKSRQSAIVANKLLKTDEYKKSSRVCIFLSMNDEIQTGAILKDIFANGKKCFIPRYDSGSTHMDFLALKSMEDMNALPETKWKIKQPTFDEQESRENCLETGGVDLIVLPGLAFSPLGARCGRGGGYYDTYLARYKATLSHLPYLAAVAFNEQVVDNVPTTDMDIPADKVLWEKGE